MKIKVNHKLIIFLGTILLFNLIFMPPIFRRKTSLKEGDVATDDIIAPYDFSVPRSEQELLDEHDAIEKRIPPIYDLDNTVVKSIYRKIDAIGSSIDSLSTIANRDSLARTVENAYGVPRDLVLYMLKMNYKTVLKRLSGDITRIYAPWVIDDRPFTYRIIAIASGDKETVESIDAIPTVAEAENMILSTGNGSYRKLVGSFLAPNVIFNQAKTQQRIDEVYNSIPRVKKEILKGEIIIEKHKRVTREGLETLQAMEMRYTALGTWDIVKTVVIRNLYLLAMIFILFRFSGITQQAMFREKNLYFIALLFSVFLIIGKIAYEANALYLLPISCFVFILTLYFNFYAGIFCTLIFASMFGMILNSLPFMIYLLISGLVACFSSQTIRTRLSLYRPMIYIGLANILTILFIDLYINKKGINFLYLGEGFLNSAISSVAVGVLLPFLERLFDFTTDLTLLELGNLNLPIFKEMSLTSPGTFHHSVVVGNLAEAGASSIGADPVLARVGAYYHDIGKMKKADYFIENQLGAKNPHDNLKPQMSVLVIVSHVKEGIDMAKAMNLPRKLMDIIAEHHGTTLVELFYKRAMHLADGVKEDDFRYPGPKPKTREAAIVMLADSVEAAARSEKNISVTKIQKIVRDSFDKKFNDGQLDECPINRYELELVKTAFLPILNGIFHPRVVYQDQETEAVPAALPPE